MNTAETGLARCGEAVWVGLLSCLLSVPAVTALAAHAAALHALDPVHAGTPGLTARYWRAFRATLGPGLRLQLLWLLLLGVAAADVAFALLVAPGAGLGPLGPVVGGVGAVGVVLLLLVRPWLAAALAGPPGAGLPTGSVGPAGTCRQAVALAGVSPWRSLLQLVLDAAVLLAALLTLAVLPLAVGLALLAHTRLRAGALEQVQRRSAQARARSTARV